MKKDAQAKLFFCNLIGIINMIFFNGFIFQPITSFVFWLSIVYVLILKKVYEKVYKLLTIVGTRPELIKLSVVQKFEKYFNHVLVHWSN